MRTTTTTSSRPPPPAPIRMSFFFLAAASASGPSTTSSSGGWTFGMERVPLRGAEAPSASGTLPVPRAMGVFPVWPVRV